jgi:cytochrome c553
MMKTTLTLIALAALAATPIAHAANLDAGKQKAQEVCQACHGMDGMSTANADYPKLAGQHRDYLVKALRDYKAGVRKNAIMGAMAQPLTAQDIENMAAYYASQPGPLKSLY